MTSKRLGLVLLGLAVAGGLSATPVGSPDGRFRDVAARLVGAAMVGDGAWAKLSHLCDRIGARLAGSAELDRAVRWAADTLRRDGHERVWTESVMVPHWVRGAALARLVAPVEDDLSVLALGGSVATPAEGLTAEVLEVWSFDELKARAAEVPGRIVLYNHDMQPNGGATKGYGAFAPLRTRGAIEAAKLGAVAAIVRSLGTASWRLPHTGAMGYEDGVARIPAAAIAAEDADRIHRLLAAGDAVRVHLRLGCETLPDASSANVLAEIRGRERPDEVVVIGAHLDSWDVGTGAHDDGAGVAIVMETMRVLRTAAPAPRRTIRAVLFTNEENGLRGGRDYAERHAAELPRHVAAVESDSGGFRPVGVGVTAGDGAEELLRRIVAPLAMIGVETVGPGGGGADISRMQPAGVPQLSLRQDTTRYFDYHHSEADTLDKVDPEDLARNVAAMAVLAYGLAELDPALPRLPAEKPDAP